MNRKTSLNGLAIVLRYEKQNRSDSDCILTFYFIVSGKKRLQLERIYSTGKVKSNYKFDTQPCANMQGMSSRSEQPALTQMRNSLQTLFLRISVMFIM